MAVGENESIRVNRLWYWYIQRVGYRHIQQHKPTLGPRLSRPCFVDRNDASVSCYCSWVSEWLAKRATTKLTLKISIMPPRSRSRRILESIRTTTGAELPCSGLFLILKGKRRGGRFESIETSMEAKLLFSGLSLEMASTER
jgi:hypothetical protein